MLFSDNFNANPLGVSATPAGWNVTRGSVDVVRPYPVQGRQIDMDGVSRAPAVMQTQTAFHFKSGYIYKLSFDYGKRSPSQQFLRFGVGSITDNLTASGPIFAQLVRHSFSFAVTSGFDASILFSGVKGRKAGMMLDNVMLEEISTIPLPPAAMLLGSGLVGLGALKRRRTSKA